MLTLFRSKSTTKFMFFTQHLALSIPLLFLALLTQASPIQAYTFSSFDYPDASETYATGIDNSGHIVGWYRDISNIYGNGHSFLLNVATGHYSSINYDNDYVTVAYGINDAGVIVGGYHEYAEFDIPYSGFLRNNKGQFTTFDYPVSDVFGTWATGINSAGQIVGSYVNGTYKFHGFLRDSAGQFVSLNHPGAYDIEANGINNNSEIVGAYWESDYCRAHAFLRDSAGQFTSLDYPGADGTHALGINNSGQIVGIYWASNECGLSPHGFLRNGAGQFIAFDYPASNGSWPNSINDAGQIVGHYLDNNSISHGFITSVPPQPTISQTPMSGPPGITFTQSGANFTPNSTATLHFKKPDGGEYSPTKKALDAIGHFEIAYTAPSDKPAGTYTWWAIDDTTGGKSNEISYEITSPVSFPFSVNTHWYNWATTFNQYREVGKRFGFVRDGGWWKDLEAKDYKNNTAWKNARWSYEFDLQLANCDQELTDYTSGYDELMKKFQAADSPQLLLLLNATNSKLSADPNGITYAQYYDYVSRVVERYDGDGNNDMPGLVRPVEYFEIGNEVDCKKHTDDIPLVVGNYVKTRLIPAYRAAKAANPNAVVINAGLSMECGSERGNQGFDLPYLENMLAVIKKAGGAKNQYFMDALAIHYYNQIENPEYFDDNIRKVKALLAKYKIQSKPIWITEFGIATRDNANGKIREEDQASVLLRYLNLMAYHIITNPFVYSLKDLNSATPEDDEKVCGLYRVDCEAGSEIIKEKLSVTVLSNYAMKIKGLTVKSINSSTQRKQGVFRITYGDGQKNVQVLWYSKRNGTGIDSEGHDLSAEKKNVKVSLGGRTGILSDMYGNVTNSSLADQSSVQLGEQPQYIEY